MANSWDWFDHIYCGTVAKSVNRQQFMEQQADQLGMIFQWIVGELVTEKRNLACTQNHLVAYRDALEHGYKRILVMEDDCIYLPEVSNLGNCLAELETIPDWGICYLGAYLYGPLIEVGKKRIRRATKAVWLHSYAINEWLMKRLLEPTFLELYKEKPLDLVVHEQILSLNVGYVCRPMMATQRPCWSEVANKFEDMTQMWEDGLRWTR